MRITAKVMIHKQLRLLFLGIYGGETGIRTLDTLRYTRFPSVRLQPLGHLSAIRTDLLNLPYSTDWFSAG
jgi:hypothetical protein